MQGGREKRVPLHRRNTLEYATKGTYCDPHLQNRNVKLCSHQPSPKETIWFSEIRLDRLSNVAFVFLGGLYLELCSALLCLNINSFPYMKNFASSVLQNYPENKKLSITAFGFSWECSLHGSCEQGLFCCRVPKEPG